VVVIIWCLLVKLLLVVFKVKQVRVVQFYSHVLFIIIKLMSGFVNLSGDEFGMVVATNENDSKYIFHLHFYTTMEMLLQKLIVIYL
jgi:hypothetical protein